MPQTPNRKMRSREMAIAFVNNNNAFANKGNTFDK